MRKHRNNGKTEMPSVDMAPLIDIVFLLLIFFIVSTSFLKESAIKIDQPESSLSTPVSEGIIALILTKDGDVFFNDVKFEINDIEKIKGFIQMKNTNDFLIKADKGSQTGMLLSLQESCYLAGAESVRIGSLIR